MISKATCHPEQSNKARGMCAACYKRWQYARNPQRYRDYQAQYRSTQEGREKCNKIMQDRRNKYPEKYLLIDARSRAKATGLTCTISEKDIIIPDFCPVFEIPLSKNKKSPRGNSPSLDRIDVSKGYIPGNVAVISMKANRLKNSATLSDLMLITNYMLRHVKIGTVS